jgi:hypothetical protein
MKIYNMELINSLLVRLCSWIIILSDKNSEGFDRIPQQILVGGVDNLTVAMHKLILLIYSEKRFLCNGLYPKLYQCSKRVNKTWFITDQWRIFAHHPKYLKTQSLRRFWRYRMRTVQT